MSLIVFSEIFVRGEFTLADFFPEVIASALVLKDKTLANLTEDEFRAALLPKVQGSVNLYLAAANEPLDFLLFFSSAQSFSGNAGQNGREEIGLIGAGLMGSALAERLLAAGFSVLGFDLDAARRLVAQLRPVGGEGEFVEPVAAQTFLPPRSLMLLAGDVVDTSTFWPAS